MNLFRKKPSRRKRLLVTFAVLCDVAWRTAAVRTALKRHELKWVVPLATVSSMGTLPMLYFWRHRGRPTQSAMRGQV